MQRFLVLKTGLKRYEDFQTHTYRIPRKFGKIIILKYF